MARRLPWKRASQDSPGVIQREDVVAMPPRRRMGGGASAPGSPAPRRGHAFISDPVRSPSTSPPPERPEERCMIPGPLDDDKYRMVEDEFLAVAQRFTAHLHRAEYDRLKALAKTQNAATIREIERPVVYAMTPTATAVRRREKMKRLAKQRDALRDMRGEETGSEEEEEGHAASTTGSLWGLMDGPGRTSGVIMPSSMGSKTRAAAGFCSSASSKPGRGGTSSSVTGGEPAERRRREGLPRQNSNETPATRMQITARGHSATAGPSRSHNSLTETAKGKRRVSFFSDHDDNDNDDDDDDDDDTFGIHARRLERKK